MLLNGMRGTDSRRNCPTGGRVCATLQLLCKLVCCWPDWLAGWLTCCQAAVGGAPQKPRTSSFHLSRPSAVGTRMAARLSMVPAATTACCRTMFVHWRLWPPLLLAPCHARGWTVPAEKVAPRWRLPFSLRATCPNIVICFCKSCADMGLSPASIITAALLTCERNAGFIPHMRRKQRFWKLSKRLLSYFRSQSDSRP